MGGRIRRYVPVRDGKEGKRSGMEMVMYVILLGREEFKNRDRTR